jgi:uncharacterized protein (DUF58 family)
LIPQLLEQVVLHVFLVLAVAALPLLALAGRRIFPHTVLLLLASVPCALTLLLLVAPETLRLILLADGLVLTVAVADLLTLPRRGRLEAQREVVRVASLGKPHRVTLIIANRARSACRARLRDDLPDPLVATPAEHTVLLAGRTRRTLQYRFRAQARGAFQLHCVYARLHSRLGLWKRFDRLPCHSTIHVYPDMQQLGQYALLARTDRLSLMGVRRSRKVGQDHDFERLRDYTQDDNYKLIDWRATARRNKLTVKQFQTSQSQRIVLLLDCGRMMNNEAAGLSLLDHALNAMLMLGYVALRQGDSVGLVCFSDRIHNYVPPRGGMSQMNHLLHASFDRFPQLVESRYDLAFLHLASHCRKRSLVVLVSNLIDEVNSHQVQQYLSMQTRRHLPLGVLLRDHQLFRAADRQQPAGSELYRAAAAAQILSWRHEVLADLEHQGVLVLDVLPEDMTAPLINRYLDIKARHLL